MNKLKVLEAMNMIGDDLVKEAEVPSDTVSEAVKGEKISGEVTVSGVEVYRRSGWRWFAAIASAVVIIGAVTAAGGFYLKNRGGSAPDNEIIESEALAPTTGTSENESSSGEGGRPDETTTQTLVSHAVVVSEENDETPTAAAETARNTDGPARPGEKPRNTNTQAAASSRTTTAKTTAPAKTTTTAKTEKAPPTTFPPKPEAPADGRMTLHRVQELSEFGDKLTFGDFKNYDHEDIGSGVTVWTIPVYAENKNGDMEFEFTLVVNSLTGDGKEPCGVVELFYGKYTNPSKQEHIDIRYDDVWDFVVKCRRKEGDPGYLENVLGNIKDCHVDFIRCVEIKHPMYDYPVALGYSEIKELIPMIQKLSFSKSVGDEWRNLDGSFTHIYVTDNQGVIHEYTLAGNKYFVIEGTGYEANYNDLLAIDTYTLSLLGKNEPSGPVNVSGVWCWHDATVSSFDIRGFENITIKQFPDYVFSWNGMKRTIEVYSKKTREKFGSVATMGQAYFADINNDGYPELCTTYDWGLSSRIVGEIAVWDIQNDLIYRMNDPDNEMLYWLYEEDGELRVNRQPSISSWGLPSKHGELGKLIISKESFGELAFVPV